ncbi:MAG: T9SS type A sorting domain-containing protein, partial [Bacteroidota bacterium]|nr:T9SS type A sorting domain-containing protein [Bacteroidota bacterium]
HSGIVSGIDVADINGDGLMDIAVSANIAGNSIFADSMRIYYQLGGGKYIDGGKYPCGPAGRVLRIGDLNNDSLNDIAVCSRDSGIIHIFYQKAGHSFGQSTVIQCDYSFGFDRIINIGDLNHDGQQDLIINTSPDGFGLTIFYQDVNGALVKGNSFGLFLGEVHDIELADLNNDGKIDIVAPWGGNSPNAKLYLFYQNENGIDFTKGIIHDMLDIPETAAIGDLDMDGRPDIAIAHGGWETMTILHQNNNGSFEQFRYRIPYCSHYYSRGLSIGDITGDSRPDMLIADWEHGTNVIINTTIPLSVQLVNSNTPRTMQLVQNYPNPFNGSTTISVEIMTESVVMLDIYNVLGRKVATLVNGKLTTGVHTFRWEPEISSGVYFARLSAITLNGQPTSAGTLIRKMIYIK